MELPMYVEASQRFMHQVVSSLVTDRSEIRNPTKFDDKPMSLLKFLNFKPTEGVT